MSEIAVREINQLDPTGGRLVAWALAANAAHGLAKALFGTDFVPDSIKQEGDATAAILMGDELGLSPIASLRSVYVIKGTPALYARTMVALALSHGHEIWTVSSTDESVEVNGKRSGSEHIEKSVWTLARATKAGYTTNPSRKYQTNPQEMLYAKAASEVARKIAADILLGVPFSVEDLELEPAAVKSMTREKKSPSESVAIARKTATENAGDVEEPEFDDDDVDKKADKATGEITNSPDLPTQSPDNSKDDAEPISAAQIRTIGAAMTRLGMTDRAIAIAYVGDVCQREISSRKDLSKDEASKVIRSLLADENALKDPSDSANQKQLEAEAKADGEE